MAVFSFSLCVSICDAQISVAGDVNPNSVVNPTWNVDGFLTVGGTGVGNLNVEAGGIVQISRSLSVGAGAEGVGVVSVTGVGSQLQANFSIGAAHPDGTGTLNIEAGGVVSGRQALIGNGLLGLGGGTVTVNGVGSQWNLSERLSVRDREGVLNVESGGVVNSSGGGILGGDVDGIVNVTGAGSRWNSTAMSVSSSNSVARLNIEGGGVVNTAGALASASIGSNGPESQGIVRVSGAGSRWEIAEFLTLGDFSGTATLIIEDGGVVTSGDRFARIAGLGESVVTVSGVDSLWDVTGALQVGTSGVITNGRLNINSGGVASSDSGSISDGDIATVTGAGSQWSVAGRLFMGGGTLNIENDGLVVTGELAVNSATINLRGGTLQTQELDLSPGVVNSASVLNVTGGTLEVTNFVGDLTQTDGVIDIANIDGNLIQEGGILAPGNSPGTTSITGNYNLNNGLIEIEIAGTTQGSLYDFIDVDGLVAIGAANTGLNVRFLDGFEDSIAATDTLTILNSDDGLSGVFSGLPDGSRIQTADSLGSFQINYASNSIILSNYVSSVSEVLLGDCNLDGVVNFSDITPFISILQAGFLAEADVNEDEVVDFLDIRPFIKILASS